MRFGKKILCPLNSGSFPYSLDFLKDVNIAYPLRHDLAVEARQSGRRIILHRARPRALFPAAKGMIPWRRTVPSDPPP